jgi:hypothetical protein
MFSPQPPGIQLMAAKARERQSDLLREEERGRPVRKVGSAGYDLMDRVLTAVGDVLVSTGEKLRERRMPVMPQGSEAYQSN